ncbi:conserved hypothetical protein [Ricinus communis]|uniref:Uncharacterized protein n=1 Tax=Ricinus communis TaxID=3988 RepID=B9T5V0_RICCO|nr:conserved hypothetical protein [Ricinus communis]
MEKVQAPTREEGESEFVGRAVGEGGALRQQEINDKATRGTVIHNIGITFGMHEPAGAIV